MDKSFPYIPILSDFIELFFPSICELCLTPLIEQEQHLCISCLLKLPLTRFQANQQNLTVSRLAGKFPFVFASSYLYLFEKSDTARLIKQMKYQGTPLVGKYLGRRFAEELQAIPALQTVDCIIPIPLHPSKLRARGYNQSTYIAKGIAAGLHKPLEVGLLRKKKVQSSQTVQGRLERYHNQQQSFYCAAKRQRPYQGKHILLVDDVITTGATITAAANRLISDCQAKISVLSLFIA